MERKFITLKLNQVSWSYVQIQSKIISMKCQKYEVGFFTVNNEVVISAHRYL